MSNEDVHVLMLPWSASGHMIPFFRLSVALARSGVRVSYVSTLWNVSSLPGFLRASENLLTFVELPLPTLDVLEGGEATVDLPFENIQYLEVTYNILKQPFAELLQGLSPDWDVGEMVPHWAAEIARGKQAGLV